MFALEQWKSQEDLEKLQENRLDRAFEIAARAPFYAKLLNVPSGARKSGGFAMLESLPTTQKSDVQASPDAFIPDDFRNRRVITHKTTGSTGKPLEIRMDEETATIRSSVQLLSHLECGMTPLSLFASIELMNTEGGRHSGRLCGVIPTLPLDILEDERKNLETMRRKKADSLGVYPSAMTTLARTNLDSGSRISLKRVISGAEMLTMGWRKLLEESFSCPVFNKYGSWEFGPIAWECPGEHGMHVNTGTFHMEILDSKNRPVKGQAVGRIVLTSLTNRAMPLIRYEMGDLASWGGPCKCGRGLRVLRTLEGRCDDMVVLPSGRLRSPLSVRFTDLECVVKGIRTYQLVQEREDLFVFRYVPTPAGFPESSKADIIRRISEACLGEAVKVEFEQVESISLKGDGKLNRLVSKVARRRSIQDRCEPS